MIVMTSANNLQLHISIKNRLEVFLLNQEIVYDRKSEMTGIRNSSFEQYLCHFGSLSCNVISFADDILLLSPSVSALQDLLYICESELAALDLSINAKKSCCIRIGRRHNISCANLITASGKSINWNVEMRYLGIFLLSSNTFKCSFDHAKSCFFRAFNAIFGKVGRIATDDIILKLLYCKCLPCLLYATDVIPLNTYCYRSLQFTFDRLLFKIFKTSSIDVINEIKLNFGIIPIKDIVQKRKLNFKTKVSGSNNVLCNLCYGVIN